MNATFNTTEKKRRQETCEKCCLKRDCKDFS